MLLQARTLVSGTNETATGGDQGSGVARHLFFHVVLAEFNLVVTRIIQVFVVREVTKRKKDFTAFGTW